MRGALDWKGDQALMGADYYWSWLANTLESACCSIAALALVDKLYFVSMADYESLGGKMGTLGTWSLRPQFRNPVHTDLVLKSILLNFSQYIPPASSTKSLFRRLNPGGKRWTKGRIKKFEGGMVVLISALFNPRIVAGREPICLFQFWCTAIEFDGFL